VSKATATGIPKSMIVGAVAWAEGSYTPAGATKVKVAYSSNAPEVLAVDAAGRLVAKSPGKVTIPVKAGGKAKTYTVTVR
jgi:uncharacterized protein YjdB